MQVNTRAIKLLIKAKYFALLHNDHNLVREIDELLEQEAAYEVNFEYVQKQYLSQGHDAEIRRT